MSVPAEQSQLSLWALGSAPFILGVNLTDKVTNAFGTSQGLTTDGLRMLENRGVIEVDQDAIDASRISMSDTAQIFAKLEPRGDAVVGLFDTDQTAGATPEVISTTASASGCRPARAAIASRTSGPARLEIISSAGPDPGDRRTRGRRAAARHADRRGADQTTNRSGCRLAAAAPALN